MGPWFHNGAAIYNEPVLSLKGFEIWATVFVMVMLQIYNGPVLSLKGSEGWAPCLLVVHNGAMTYKGFIRISTKEPILGASWTQGGAVKHESPSL